MIEMAINNKNLKICPLPDIDVGDNPVWGKYVIESFNQIFGSDPDLVISGNDKERLQWLTPEIAPYTSELLISRKSINISATDCRNMILSGDERLKEYISPEIYESRNKLKEILKSIQ